jgi:uncharacterized protein YrrD
LTHTESAQAVVTLCPHVERREHEMQFKQNTTVKSATGETVGRVNHFVIDPRTNEITDLVVEKGFLFMEDRVVPIQSVEYADEDEIRLAPGRGEPDDFPLFESQYYVRTDEYSTEPGVFPTRSAYYYYPPVAGMGSWGAVPVVPPAGAPGLAAGVPQPGGLMNSPVAHEADSLASQGVNNEAIMEDDVVALHTGADVFSSDGHLVGQIDEIFTSAESNRVTHVLISQGLIGKTYKMLPMHWIANLSGERVDLGTSAKVVEDLPDYRR